MKKRIKKWLKINVKLESDREGEKERERKKWKVWIKRRKTERR